MEPAWLGQTSVGGHTALGFGLQDMSQALWEAAGEGWVLWVEALHLLLAGLTGGKRFWHLGSFTL